MKKIVKKSSIKKAQTGTSTKKVTVGRLKEVRDSLLDRAESKGSSALSEMMPFGGPRTKEGRQRQMERINSLNRSRIGDEERAARYDKIIKKAGAKKKMGGTVKKTKSVPKGMHKMPNGSLMKNSKMKAGGKMKKCRYGCK